MDKWERQPLRVGMLLGFTLIPMMGLLQEFILRLVIDHHPLWFTYYHALRFFFPGGLYGAILGAGALQSVVAQRKGDFVATRRYLLRAGSATLLLSTYSLYSYASWISSNFSIPLRLLLSLSKVAVYIVFHGLAQNLPVPCSLLMLVLGLLMRSRR